MIYTPELIKQVAPSVFATEPSQKMTNRYKFVPTDQIMEFFEREGWNVSSVKQSGRGVHSLHEIKFRNGELPKVGDTLVEAIIRNSHNGMSTLKISSGLHRLVCSNGLVVPTAACDQLNIRHTGFNLDDVKRLTESFSKRLPKIQYSVDRMMERQLTIDEKIDFALKASKFRFTNGTKPNSLDVMDLLNPNRVEDEGDELWKVFNVVQEKFIRGGVGYFTNTGRRSRLRGIKSIIQNNNVNIKLWETAEEMI
jgi:hypothetical protein